MNSSICKKSQFIIEKGKISFEKTFYNTNVTKTGKNLICKDDELEGFYFLLMNE